MRRFTVYASGIEHRGYFASPFSETKWKVIYPLQNSFEYVTVTPGEDAEAQIRKWIDEQIAEKETQQKAETESMNAYYANLLAELTKKFATYANLHMTSYESVTGRFLGKQLLVEATNETVRKWIDSFNNTCKICQKELIGLTLEGSEPSGEYGKNIYHLSLQSIQPKERKQVKGSKKMNRKFTKYPGKAITAAGKSNVFVYDGVSEVPKDVMKVRIQDGVTEIPKQAFQFRENLKSVVIPDSVTSIGDSAFLATSLTSITIPDSVTSIGDSAFRFADLKQVSIPDSVTSIGDSAFGFCKKLNSVTIGKSVTRIGYRTFEECSALTSVTLPEGLITIGNHAFVDCKKLANITIPKTVNEIEHGAFCRCCRLEAIDIPYGVTVIEDGVFFACTNLSSVSIPDSVTKIKDQAFWYCQSLDSLNIPDSVTEIGEDAFGKTPLDASNNSPAADAKTEYKSMREAVLNGEVEQLAYDSEYSEFIYEIYGQVMKLTKRRNLDILPSVQGGEGTVDATYEYQGEEVHAQWDYADECQALEDMVRKNHTLAAFKGALKAWLLDKLTNVI